MAVVAVVPYRFRVDPRQPRRLPLLDRVAVKTSCKASWDDMVGDDTVRFCCTCSQNVYDLSAMREEEAEAFLAQHVAATSGGPMPCARMYLRSDGRVLTSECPTGATRRHLRRFATAVVAGAAGAALLAGGVDIAARPVLGAGIEDDRTPEALLQTQLVMGTLVEPERDDSYDVNAALRSDEPTTSDVEPEGAGPARRRSVRGAPTENVILANAVLVSSSR